MASAPACACPPSGSRRVRRRRRSWCAWLSSVPAMDFKLELVPVPVADVDRAKAFYTDQAGFHLDHDHRVNENLRFVQLTPPGSACSISIGEGLVDTPPGSAKGLQLVVGDIEAARAELNGRGLDVGEVQEFPWGKFEFFSDHDGNSWSVQEITPRQYADARTQRPRWRA